MIVFSLMCWGASLFIPRDRRGRARPDDRSQHRSPRPAACSSFCAKIRALWWGALVTSWFWLVGAVALSLMPPLVKNVLGGNEEVVTHLPGDLLDLDRGRLRTGGLAGRRPDHPAADADRRGPAGHLRPRSRLVDLRLAAAIPGLEGYRRSFRVRARHLRIAIDLAGLAIAGGLFIVPVFAAVQAWAGADRRARVIAGVNVLNAAFMAAARS